MRETTPTLQYKDEISTEDARRATEDGSRRGEPLLHSPEMPLVPQADEDTSARLRLVELTDRDRALFAETVEERFLNVTVAKGIAPDTLDFFDAAEIVERTLPESARAAFAAMRRGSVDAVLLRGLPADPRPGATPLHPSEPSTLPRRGHAWVAMAVRRLGHELAYALEKNGSVVHNIHPTREGAATQSNASWQVSLCLHTENAFHPIRPDFVILYCVRAGHEPPATRLALLDDLLTHLTDEEIAVLREPRFTVRVVDSFRSEGEVDLQVPVSVLGGSPRWPTVRWHETLRGTDDAAARVCQAFADAATCATQHVRMQAGDLLVFANDRCLHGRDRFDAALDGRDRWLLRAYVLRDRIRIIPVVTPARPRVVRLDLVTKAGD